MTTAYTANSNESRYWQSRNTLAEAARQLNDKLVSSDITEAFADQIAAELRAITDRLADMPQVSGLVEMGRRENRGSVDNVMGELVAMAGRSPHSRGKNIRVGSREPFYSRRPSRAPQEMSMEAGWRAFLTT